jgi:hypothetical protein
MVYVFSITTPKNTPEPSKGKTTIAKMERGIIKRFEIKFPPGPAGLLHVRIRRGSHQVWPTNPLGSFASDFETIAFDDEFDLTVPPYQLEIDTWNVDDTYDHTVYVRFLLKPAPLLVVEPEPRRPRERMIRT